MKIFSERNPPFSSGPNFYRQGFTPTRRRHQRDISTAASRRIREYTGILNGTVGSLALGWKLSGILAVIYIVFYLASLSSLCR